MANKTDAIGVFDSGVGGISVLKELVKVLPGETFLYYGDSANAPYGTRTTEEVQALTLQAARLLFDRKIKALVVACNTATAAAITTLRQTWPDAIIIGIEPALKLAADHFPKGNVAVLATPVTLREEKYLHLTQQFAQMEVTSIGLPGLVELIEAGADQIQLETFLCPILSPYKGKLDAAVLGCTHYPFAAKAISRILGDKTVLLDGGIGTALQTKRRLAEADLLSTGTVGRVIFENSAPEKDILIRCATLLNQE